jgi:hypothetical protein
MSNKQDSSGPWSLLIEWILASSLGWAVGLAAGMLLTEVASHLSWLNEDRVFAFATLASLGIAIGGAQWIVMRRYLPKSVRWITATVVGFLLCLVILVVFNLVGLGGTGIWDDLLLLALLGTAIGTSQWWVLRHQYHNAGMWVLVSAVGFLAFIWIILNPSSSLSDLVIRGTIIGTLAAMLSGAALVWLGRRPLVTASPRAM